MVHQFQRFENQWNQNLMFDEKVIVDYYIRNQYGGQKQAQQYLEMVQNLIRIIMNCKKQWQIDNDGKKFELNYDVDSIMIQYYPCSWFVQTNQIYQEQVNKVLSKQDSKLMRKIYGYKLELQYQSTSEIFEINMRKQDRQNIMNIMLNINRKFFQSYKTNYLETTDDSDKNNAISVVDIDDFDNQLCTNTYISHNYSSGQKNDLNSSSDYEVIYNSQNSNNSQCDQDVAGLIQIYDDADQKIGSIEPFQLIIMSNRYVKMESSKLKSSLFDKRYSQLQVNVENLKDIQQVVKDNLEMLRYIEIRKVINIDCENLVKIFDDLKQEQFEDIEDIDDDPYIQNEFQKRYGIAWNSFKQLYEWFKDFGFRKETEDFFCRFMVEAFKNFEQDPECGYERLGIQNNKELQRMIEKRSQRNKQLRIDQPCFNFMVDLLISKKIFDNSGEIIEAIGRQDSKFFDFIYCLVLYDEKEYIRMRNLVDRVSQLFFLKNNYLDRLMDMEDGLKVKDIIERNPLIFIFFYQKYKNTINYKDYLQKMLIDIDSWMKKFKDNPFIIDYLFDSKSFKVSTEKVIILKNFQNAVEDYISSKKYLKKVLMILLQIREKDKNLVTHLINKLDNNDILKLKYNQYLSNFDFNYIKKQQHINMILPYIDDSEFRNKGLTLIDYNKISFRLDENELIKKIQELDSFNSMELMQTISELFFGYIKRGEDLQTAFLQPYINRKVYNSSQFSIKFLQSYILEVSDNELRNRLFKHMSAGHCVPFIANKIIDYNRQSEFSKVFFPQLALIMHPGYGVYNLGLGRLCSLRCGKSTLFSDVLYPLKSRKQFFYTNDNNNYTQGTVDVLFEYICQDDVESGQKKGLDQNDGLVEKQGLKHSRKNVVAMDGQGFQNQFVLSKAFILTNIVLVHIDFSELLSYKDDPEFEKQLETFFKEVKKQKDLNKDGFKCLVLVKDSDQQRIVKAIDRNEYSFGVDLIALSKYKEQIDFCICVPYLENYTQSFTDNSILISYAVNYSLAEFKNNQKKMKFDQANYVNKFLMDDKETERLQSIKKKIDDFMKLVEEIKDDMTQEDGLHVLKLLKERRFVKQQLFNSDTMANQNQNDYRVLLRSIDEKIENHPPSKILKSFKQLALDDDSILILQNLQNKLKQLTKINTKQLREQKFIQNDRHIQQIQQGQNENKQELESRQQMEKYLEENEKFNRMLEQEIQNKSICIEYLWRCLFNYMLDRNKTGFIENGERNRLIQKLRTSLQKGECIELIDGENLDFKGEITRIIFNHMYQSSVLSIVVIGKQSSGKSTLMNFCFGTQFVSADGRCTSGIYLTIQKLPQKIKYKDKVIEHILILDTEGLQGAERSDPEFDKKIVSFALCNANVVICNCYREFDTEMKKILQLCTISLSDLMQQQVLPEIYFTFGHNTTEDKSCHKTQISNLQNEVIQAKPDIHNKAQILQLIEEKIFILGIAYSQEIIEVNSGRFIHSPQSLKIMSPQFGIQTSELPKYLLESTQKDLETRKDSKYKDMELWIDNASINWEAIDKFTKIIMGYEDLVDIKNTRLASTFALEIKNKIQSMIEIDKQVDIDFQKISQDQISDNISTQQTIREYSQGFQQKMDILYEKEMTEEFNNWQQQHRTIKMGIVDEQVQKLGLDKVLYVKNYKRFLTDKIIESQLNDFDMKGVRSFKNLSTRIQNDQRYQEMKRNHPGQFEEEMLTKFEAEWNNLIRPLQEQKNYFKMFADQYINMHEMFSHKEKRMPNYQLEENDIRNINEFILKVMTNKILLDPVQDQRPEERYFYTDEKQIQIVIEDIKSRLFSKEKDEQHSFLDMKKFFKKMYLFSKMEITEQETYLQLLYSDLYKKYQDLMKQKQRSMRFNCNSEQYIALQKYLEDLYKSGFILKLYKRDLGTTQDDIYEQMISCDLNSSMKYLNKLFGNSSRNTQYILKYELSRDKNIMIDKQFEDYAKIENNVMKDKLIVSSKDKYSYYNKKYYRYHSEVYIPDFEYLQKFSKMHSFPDKHFDLHIRIFDKIISSDCTILTKKNHLSCLMFKVIDWKAFRDQLVKGIKETLRLDQIKKETNVLVLQQISMIKIEEVFVKVIYKQIDQLDKELLEKSGLKVSNYLRSNICFCAMAVILDEVTSIQSKGINRQYKIFEDSKYNYRATFLSQVKGELQRVSIVDSMQMTRKCFQNYSEEVNAQFVDTIKENFSSDSFKNTFNFHIQYKKLLDKVFEKGYEVDTTIKYFKKPQQFYADYIQKHIKKLDDYMDEMEDEMLNMFDVELQNILRIVKNLDKVLNESNYDDNNFSEFFQIYKNGGQINFNQFVKYEENILQNYLKKLFVGILLMEKVGEDFVIDQNNYSFSLKPKFNCILNKYEEINIQQNIQIGNSQILQQIKRNHQDEQYTITKLRSFIDGVLDELKSIQGIRENYVLFRNMMQVSDKKSEMIRDLQGCNYSCYFCNVQCQLGYHDDSISHRSDIYGHNLRAFAYGVYESESGQKHPSLNICNMIDLRTHMRFNQEPNLWVDIQKTNQPKYYIEYSTAKYCAHNDKLKENIWQYIGEKYCKQTNMVYKDERLGIWKESLHVVFCLDNSGSMKYDNKYIDVKNGTIDIIDRIRLNHSKRHLCRISIIFFNRYAQLYHSDTLDVEGSIDYDKIFNYPQGGTSFENALIVCQKVLSEYYLNYTHNKLLFFTDGESPYPSLAVKQMISYLGVKERKDRIKISLFCSNNSNIIMKQIETDLNTIGRDVCTLKPGIKESEFGEAMVECFDFQDQNHRQ